MPSSKSRAATANPLPSHRSRDYIDNLAGRVADKLDFQPGKDLEEVVTNRLGGKVAMQCNSDPDTELSIVVEGERDFTIFLSPYIGRLRNRFTIAHELGHYFLHSEMGKRPIRIEQEGEDRIEWEADWFAIGLLMPEDEFREAAQDLHSVEELAARFDVSDHLARTRKESLGL